MADPATATSAESEALRVSDLAGEYIRQFDAEKYLPDAVQPLYQLLVGYPILLLIVFVMIGFLAGKGIQFLLRSSLGRLAKKTSTDLDEAILTGEWRCMV